MIGQWEPGLSRDQIDQILFCNLGDRLPYFASDEIYELLAWSNGLRLWWFNGNCFDGLHDETIGKFNYWSEKPILANEDGYESYCSLALFSDGHSCIYDVPLTIQKIDRSPVFFFDRHLAEGGEPYCGLFCKSLYSFFAMCVEAEKQGVPQPTPGVTHPESIRIAASYNPSVEYWQSHLLRYVGRRSK